MKFWRGSPQGLLAVIGVLMALAALPSITGCSSNQMSPLARVFHAVDERFRPIPDAAQTELDRFADVYRKYATEADPERLEYFGFAFKRVRASYVQEVPDAKLIDSAIIGVTGADGKRRAKSMTPSDLVEAALDAMTASLDPHSAFMNANEFKESFIHTKGQFGGLGIEVTMEDGYVKVVAPIEDTPAARAGLISGDLITDVDGKSIKGMTLTEAVRLMRGAPGSKIHLRIKRADVADFDLTLERAVIQVQAVRWRNENGIAYIRVSRFSERVEGEIVKAFASIRAEIGGDPSGVVLDLRNNPGGLLDQSVILADSFLNDGEIVSVRGRRNSAWRSFKAAEGDLAGGVPMVVLINGGSASASEIVASALKFYKRATLMGSQSFGKGSVQTIIPMPLEGALRLTTALYYGPSGETLQARGVVPDIILKAKLEVEKKDGKTRRESDLPGALPAQRKADQASNFSVITEECPEAGPKKDKQLGCALAFLAAGSTEKFMASYRQRSQM